jgi:hypothetical protein
VPGSRVRIRKLWNELVKGGVVVSALLVASTSLVVSYCNNQEVRALTVRVASDQRKAAEDQRDVDLLNRFSEIYFATDRKPRFSVYIIERMNHPGWRRGLRVFLLEDTLSRRLKPPVPVSFDIDHDEWSLASDAVCNLRRDWGNAPPEPALTFDDWWRAKRVEYTDRWSNHKKTIDDLYRYMEDRRFRDPLKPCEPPVGK